MMIKTEAGNLVKRAAFEVITLCVGVDDVGSQASYSPSQ